MEIGTNIIKFKDYVIMYSDRPGYNEKLPWGGIREDAPEEVKKIYEEYVKEENECIKIGLRR